jgi:predicted ArsR family transcriptional regulator
MTVLDAYLVDPNLSFLDKVKIQAQVLVPVLRALRAELGKDKADAIVRQALRDWSRQLFGEIGASIEGSARRKWATMRSALDDATAREVDFEILRQDKQALDIDVTHCRFAAFFHAIGEPELGALLVCATDMDITAPSEGAVTLERAQTIMQGAPRCTFRYTFAPREG